MRTSGSISTGNDASCTFACMFMRDLRITAPWVAGLVTLVLSGCTATSLPHSPAPVAETYRPGETPSIRVLVSDLGSPPRDIGPLLQPVITRAGIPGISAVVLRGDNGRWNCVVWVAPEIDFAILIACNRTHTWSTVDEVAGVLLRTFAEHK